MHSILRIDCLVVVGSGGCGVVCRDVGLMMFVAQAPKCGSDSVVVYMQFASGQVNAVIR